MADLTRMLEDARRGLPGSSDRLMECLYVELRELARQRMQRERADHTLQPTALVHELFLRFQSEGTPAFRDKGHFLAAAATAIRRLLVEHARARGREKRGGDRERVPLVEPTSPEDRSDARVLALEDALEHLKALDERKARLVELRFFAGCDVGEAARALGVSESTLVRDWRLTRAWLRTQLGDGVLDGP